MTQEIIIDKFSIPNCGYYQVYYTGKRFYFTLIPEFNILKTKYGKSALFYVDDETTDDVNYNKQPFQTIERIINTIVNYVNQSPYQKDVDTIKHFSFTSSTERKDRIYEHYAKRIVERLNGNWSFSNHDGGFCFFLKNDN
ncbi:hypothetical protein [Moraxella oblonga]|uniref:hypothetical protein n=1 Tax=Moraxella oblonga TaxID=200413 RepID=UPI00082EE794|nr:hypothetical protein [Moraxella oblonga]